MFSSASSSRLYDLVRRFVILIFCFLRFFTLPALTAGILATMLAVESTSLTPDHLIHENKQSKGNFTTLSMAQARTLEMISRVTNNEK